MPFTPPPQTPNFQFPVGRIATDRYDFEAHLEGTNPPYATNFRHNATQIDLFPTLVIDGTTATTVQQALALLNDVGPEAIPQATVGTSLTNLGVVTLGGDFGGTALVPKVTGLRGFPVNSTPPTTNYVLTWGGSSWGPAPVSGGSGFTAGRDLSGTSTSQTVIGIQGNPVSATTPTSGQFLGWNGSNWIPTTVSGSFTASGDLTGSNTSQEVIGILSNHIPSLTPGFLQWTGSALAWGNPSGTFTANGDLTGSSSSQEVVGLLTKSLPLLSSGPGFLQYNGTNWIFGTPPGAFTPGSDLLGNSTSTSTNQYVSALSFSSSASGGAIAVNGTTTTLNWVSNNVTLQKSSTTLAQLGAASGDFIRFGATPGTSGSIRATSGTIIIGVNGTSILGTNGSSTFLGTITGQSLILEVGGTTVANFDQAATDYIALGAAPPGAGMIRIGTGSGASLPLTIVETETSGGATPLLMQGSGTLDLGLLTPTSPSSIGEGLTLRLFAQSAGGTANAGGSIILNAGAATTSGNPGNVSAVLEAPPGAGATPAFEVLMGATAFLQAGALSGSTTVSGIYTQPGITPSATNYGIKDDGSTLTVSGANNVNTTIAGATSPVIHTNSLGVFFGQPVGGNPVASVPASAYQYQIGMVALTNGSSNSLTNVQVCNPIIKFTGSITGTSTVLVLPAVATEWLFDFSGCTFGGSASLTIQCATATKTIQPSAAVPVRVYSDGTAHVYGVFYT